MGPRAFTRLFMLLTALALSAGPIALPPSATTLVDGHACHRAETSEPASGRSAAGTATAGHCGHCLGGSSSIGRCAPDTGNTDCEQCGLTTGILPVLAWLPFLGVAPVPPTEPKDNFADIAITPDTRPPIPSASA